MTVTAAAVSRPDVPDRAAPAPPVAIARFTIRASICPQVLNRVIGLFAQQDLIPDAVSMARRCGTMVIRLRQTDLDERRASILAEKMRSLVMVQAVALDFTAEPRGSPMLDMSH